MTMVDDAATTQAPSHADLARLYELMATITLAEKETVGAVRSGRLNAAVYPVRGLEAVCAAIGLSVTASDYMVSTYRNLGDAVAKGVSLREIVAEAYGRSGGTSKGKGGPMHLSDVNVGLMATSGIVGGGVPIAVGVALAAQLDGRGQVAITTFGDGATSIGAFHEGMNLAAVWKLPIVFVCQNNQWGEHTPIVGYAGNTNLAERAASYGMRAVQVDGFDPIATLAVLRQAVADARAGNGPVFVEALTYRLAGHSAASDFSYMPKEEFDRAMQSDPTPSFRAWLLSDGGFSEQEVAAIDARVEAAVADAMEFGTQSPPPPQSELYVDVYADPSALPTGSAQWRSQA